MITSILKTLSRGIDTMRSNSRLLLVGVLVFVLPLLFIWVAQVFLTTASDTIETAEKRRVALMHDTFATVIATSTNGVRLVDTLITDYAAENDDVTKIRIVTQDDEGFRIVEALDEEREGRYEKDDLLYRTLPLSGTDQSFIYETMIDGVRTWQVFRSVERDDAEYYIFTEHQFAFTDALLTSRQQRSYLVLSVIFLFLITLAYWLHRQVHWQQQYHILTKQLKERDRFSHMIAHEFRAPLTTIKGYASFLEGSDALSSDEKRYATNIHASAKRLVLLVNDFLEVARLQSGQIQIQKETVDLSEVFEHVVNELQGMSKEKGISLAYNTSPHRLMLHTDPARFTQIMVNLVTNSIKYTDAGQVTLEADATPRAINIRVTDTGMGISAEDQKVLFAPFTRVGGVDQTATTGTGLGMWITKELVDLLGGEIGVESIKNVGTHVVITFKR